MKRHFLIGPALAAALALPAAAEVKIALDSPPDLENSGSYVWANTFANYLSAHGIEAVEYQRGALGEEAERLDQVSSGLLEVSMSDVKTGGALNKLTFGVYLPYLFADAAELDAALEAGGLLEKINEGTTPQGVRVVAFTALGLPAGIFNTKHPVATLEDMADLRMRALDESQIELFKSWGSTGTIVSWSEVPNALQTGVADGYINPPFVPIMFGHTDFIKYFTDAAVSPSMRLAVISEDWYQGLSDEDRAVVDAAIAEATAANRAWLTARQGILEQLEAAGVQVTRLSDAERARFVEASRAVYETGVLSPDEVKLWTDAAGH